MPFEDVAAGVHSVVTDGFFYLIAVPVHDKRSAFGAAWHLVA